jgi:hypothetical protein
VRKRLIQSDIEANYCAIERWFQTGSRFLLASFPKYDSIDSSFEKEQRDAGSLKSKPRFLTSGLAPRQFTDAGLSFGAMRCFDELAVRRPQSLSVLKKASNSLISVYRATD